MKCLNLKKNVSNIHQTRCLEYLKGTNVNEIFVSHYIPFAFVFVNLNMEFHTQVLILSVLTIIIKLKL